jgi:hypothetical protein
MSSIDQAMEREDLVAAAIGTAEEICDPLWSRRLPPIPAHPLCPTRSNGFAH